MKRGLIASVAAVAASTGLCGIVLGASLLGSLVIGRPVHGQPATSRPLPAPPPGQRAAQIEQGRYLVAAGDCMACHTVKGGAPFAGGRVIETPFGRIASANLTPDPTGLAGWSADDFYKALHEGISRKAGHLYPAFPYTHYTKVTRADADAMFAYLRTIPAAANDPDRNQLPFPYNIRFLMVFWNWLYLDEGAWRPVAGKSEAWNRGAYLVQGLGHCGACHTPRNTLGGPKSDSFLHGGHFADWFAPDLTANQRTGIGGWTPDDVARFLATGANAHAAATGEMGEVVAFSTSKMTPQDRAAIAAYLKDQPASPAAATAPRPDSPVLAQGEAIFQDECSACHRMDGAGVPGFFPPLKGSANLQQAEATNAIRFVLAGARVTPVDARPTPLAMPPFAWKLSDAQVAAVVTYARNAWGNQAAAVKADDVAALRRKLVPAGGQHAPSANHHPAGPPRPDSWGTPGRAS
jgi:mono/diheme cytochrome c family protein